MSNELHLINLHQIISEKGGNIGAVDLAIQKSFLQKIGDDIFFMPPSYSKGYKFKYMLLNYINLKAEIKSRLEEEIITRWESFYKPAIEAPARKPAEPKETVSVSPRKITANPTTGAKKPRTLKKEVQDLARDMKFLENKIEKMIKDLDLRRIKC